MEILHISEIGNNLCDGMTAVIPSHVIEQSKIENVTYLNLRNTELKGFENQVRFQDNIGSEEFKDFIHKYDIVIFHGLYIMAYVKIGKVLDSLSLPYVIVPHGSMTKMSQKKKWFKKIIANMLFFKTFIAHAAAVQYLSRGEEESSAFRCKKSFIGTNGINVSPYTKAYKNNTIKQITFIGRLDVFYKGLDFLIEAISRNRDLLLERDIKISIYGNDIKGRGNQVRNLIKKYGVEDIVSLNKEIFGEDKRNVLLNTDVFVLTSRSEGMPMGVLEALSYGIPCMVSFGTNLKRYVEDYNAGWTCENNIQSVSDMLRHAITEDNELCIKSKNSLELINNVFSWPVVSNETINFYHTLI